MSELPRQTEYLRPGQVFWGGAGHCVGTLLGSCVSVTLWHPVFHFGAVCHYLLPLRPQGSDADGRYGDDAMQSMVDCIKRSGTRIQDYEGKIFGGGNMFPAQMHARPGAQMDVIGNRNILAGMQFFKIHGIRQVAADVGGNGYRTILFDISTGAVWVRRQQEPD